MSSTKDGKVICSRCGSGDTESRGKKNGKRQYRCRECERNGRPKYFKLSEKNHEILRTKTAARILLFDIETAPMEVYVWSLRHNDYISPDAVIKDYSVLCWSAKWLFEPDVMGEKVTGRDAIARRDSTILKPMWKLLDEADIVVVQNGKKFDIPKLNSRFLLAGYSPPMYYQVVDTKEVMSRHFGFSSNKLDYVNKLLGIEGKDEMEFQDWVDYVRGSDEAGEKMLDYNKNDVVIMEELYLKLRPWIPGHPNLGVWTDVEKSALVLCISTEPAPARFRPYTQAG